MLLAVVRRNCRGDISDIEPVAGSREWGREGQSLRLCFNMMAKEVNRKMV